VVSDEELLQQTLAEKARLCCLIDRLKQELSALKENNRAFAKENNSLKTEKTELNVCLKPL
jgi:peptidoglycan hydrolase CwlO-like protein